MIGETFEDDSNLQPLDAVLGDLGRAIEALRNLLRHPQRERGRDAAQDTPAWVPASAGSGGDALSSVEEVLSIPAAGSEPQELFTLATDRICRLLGADRVMLFAADGSHLRPRSARGFRRDDLDSIVVEAGDGIVGRTFAARRALTASSIAAVEDAFIERFPVKEAIAVPVRAEDDVVGVLYAGRRADGRPFGPSDMLLLLVIADRMGSAFVHQSLLDRRSASIARLAELAEFAGEAPLSRDLTDILSRAAEVACRLVGVRAAAVAVGVEDLAVVAARGLPGGPDSWRPISRREGLTAELYARDGPITCRDVQAKRGAERSFLGEGRFHGCLLVPLKLRGLMLGVLYLADTEVRDFSVEDIAVSRVLAAMSASAIENSRVHTVLASGLETARAAQDQQLEAEKVRSLADVSGGIAREFNQIFAVILGKSQLLLARATDESIREGLGVIEDAAWRGADVVHRVGSLAVPAVEAAGDVTDMKALVQDAVALARTRWKDDGGEQRPIEIAADLEAVSPVRGNQAALQDAVEHLVRNALDAMPGGGRLVLTLRPRDGGVELVVEDTGEGVGEEVRRRMFDPFFTTRAPARMGLGLTMVRSAVSRCGGRVDVSPGTGGRGTAVSVWLPAPSGAVPGPGATETLAGPGEAARPAPVRQEPGGVPDADAGAVPRRAARASILVLEDEEPVRAMLVQALTEAGHEVHAAPDGPAGLAKIELGSFDVVLTDLALPQRSGLAVARSVKRASPRTRVVLITGWGHLLDPERLREHGVDLMLVKPFGAERAIAVVSEALRLHASA
jgi:signal transduction histidine kinase